MSVIQEFTKGFYRQNPVFRQILGLCPTLATSTSVENGLGMGIAATFVLICSNVIVSMIRNIVPAKIRIPIYIVVIATFVTIVDLAMAVIGGAIAAGSAPQHRLADGACRGAPGPRGATSPPRDATRTRAPRAPRRRR